MMDILGSPSFVPQGLPGQVAMAYSVRTTFRLRGRWIWLPVLLGIFIAAAAMDVVIARWAHEMKPATFAGPLRKVFWWFGHASSTLVIAVVVGVCHRLRWRAALLLGGCALAGGLANTIGKWIVGRTRPFKDVPAFEFHPFSNGFSGLIMGVKNSAFPSGHACLAFAVATCLYHLVPRRWGWLLYFGASLVAIFRVLEGAHYPSDVVGGAVVGIIAAKLVLYLCRTRTVASADSSLQRSEYCQLDDDGNTVRTVADLLERHPAARHGN